MDWYDRYDYALPAKLPKQTFVEPKLGCPLDCGLCSDHEQHTCIGVLEITDNCNLTCPMCYAASSPRQQHKSWEDAVRAIDALVRAEGHADVLQLSGGEPTVHPEMERILDYALAQPIQYVMINTNGIRMSQDQPFLDRIAKHRDRVEIYLQMDGVSDDVYQTLRGRPLWEIKQHALERITDSGLHVTLVSTLQAGVNDHQLGDLVRLAASNSSITGLSLQPATYCGRHILPSTLENRCTFPDVVEGLCQQSDDLFRETDFFPLPCAHPNCHILSLAYRNEGTLIPLTRFIDAKSNLDLLANGLSFNRQEGKRLAMQYLTRNNCCAPGTSCNPSEDSSIERKSAESFFAEAIAKQLGAKQLLRITITSFLDAYNFDVRRVMKCCTHHVLPSGHLIPFCAYNTLYRNGHVPLPALATNVPTQ